MGVWKGWYEQNGEKHEMRLKKFNVKGSKISGKGQDENGEFEFIGSYTADKQVKFVKQYNAYQVHYEGVRAGQTLQGHWSVNGLSGGFYLYKEREWVGHYVQDGNHQEMKLGSLKIKGEHITGRGEDNVGSFVIDGRIAPNGTLEF